MEWSKLNYVASVAFACVALAGLMALAIMRGDWDGMTWAVAAAAAAWASAYAGHVSSAFFEVGRHVWQLLFVVLALILLLIALVFGWLSMGLG